MADEPEPTEDPAAPTGEGAAAPETGDPTTSGADAPQQPPADPSTALPGRRRAPAGPEGEAIGSGDPLAAFGHEGVDEHDPVYGSVRRRRRPSLAVLAVLVVLALGIGAAVVLLPGDDEPSGFQPPSPESPQALQAQVRTFADAWVRSDFEVAVASTGVCAEEHGADGATELLDATLTAIEAFQGVERDQLVVRRVVTRNVGGGKGEARIDLDPAPFTDPLDAVGQFLPWRLEGDRWGLATCTFGGAPLDPDAEPTDRTRSDVIRAMLGRGLEEELAICVADTLIEDFGIAAVDPAALTDQQDSVRTAAEATCRSSPTQAGIGFGTPDSPVPLGAIGRVGDWDARVVDVTFDATALVMEAFDFNEPPPEGEQLVLVRLEMTYRGEAGASTLLDLGFRLESAGGRTYDEFDDTCGLFPDEIDQVTEVGAGEAVRGTMCWSVVIGDISEVGMVLDSLVTLDDPKVWFALR